MTGCIEWASLLVLSSAARERLVGLESCWGSCCSARGWRRWSALACIWIMKFRKMSHNIGKVLAPKLIRAQATAAHKEKLCMHAVYHSARLLDYNTSSCMTHAGMQAIETENVSWSRLIHMNILRRIIAVLSLLLPACVSSTACAPILAHVSFGSPSVLAAGCLREICLLECQHLCSLLAIRLIQNII